VIDFPDSPSLNDTFTVGGKTWKWDGSVWVSQGASISIPDPFKPQNYHETYTTASSSSGSLTIDTSSANVFQVTLTEDVTSTTFSNPPSSGTAYGMTVRVIQDSTARTIAWPNSVDWSGGSAPAISTGNGAVDVFVFFTTDGGTTWFGFLSGKALA
jgi:hypothetical protein